MGEIILEAAGVVGRKDKKAFQGWASMDFENRRFRVLKCGG